MRVHQAGGEMHFKHTSRLGLFGVVRGQGEKESTGDQGSGGTEAVSLGRLHMPCRRV